MADLEADIDRLYQLSLEEFTPARNALARERRAPELKKLEKPGLAAWAVNQLYWRHRATWDRLVASAEKLRAEHRKLLGGQPADIRSAEAAYREAVRAAGEKTRELLAHAGQAASPATAAAVQETLESLPSEGRPGRLTRPLKPRGFEALAGVAVRPALRVVHPPARDAREARAGRGPGVEPPRAARRAETTRGEQRGEAEARTRAREDARVRMQEARRRAQEAREQERRRREARKALAKAEAAMLRADEEVRRAEKELAARRARRDEAVAAYEQARRRAHE